MKLRKVDVYKAATAVCDDILTTEDVKEISFEFGYRTMFNFMNSNGNDDESKLASYIYDSWLSNNKIKLIRWRYLRDISLYIIRRSEKGLVEKKLNRIIGTIESYSFWLGHLRGIKLPTDIIQMIITNI